MFHDLDETIRKLLTDELPVKNGEIDVAFDQPKREWSARLSKPTVNFFLYDVRENNVLRQHHWEQLHAGNGRAHRARLKRTPMRVNCHYLLTTWANDPEDEHRLLARVLLALFRFPALPPERLVGALQQQPFAVPARLAGHDKLANPAEVWSALDNELRPGVSYLVTLALDPWMETRDEPLVRTRTLRTGLPEGPLTMWRSLATARAGLRFGELHVIGGTVRDKRHGSAPLAGIQVAIKGSGLFTTTDKNGRFTLGGLPAGEYTLVAWPAKGKPREKRFVLPEPAAATAVPAAHDVYDIEI